LGRYSGQSGSVYVVGEMFIGRYRVLIPESQKWSRRAVPIGRRKEMTKPEAKRKLRLMLDAMDVNKDINLLKGFGPGKTFKQKAARWEETDLIMHKPSSSNIPYIIKKHLIPSFGDLPLDQITEDRVKEWRADLVKQGKLAPKTIHNVWKILRLILGKKHVIGWDIKLPKLTRKERRYFTAEEMKKIVDGCKNPQHKALFAIQAATGARFGEIAGLHVEDLDFENSIVHIRRSVYKHQELAPKTDAGYRDVNVDPSAMKIVKEYIGDRTTGRVFDSKKGTPLVCGDINRYVLKPLLEKLGIKPATTHAFRHGRVSILQQNRVPGDLIKEWVGHTSLKITSGYTHFDDAYRSDIVKNLK